MFIKRKGCDHESDHSKRDGPKQRVISVLAFKSVSNDSHDVRVPRAAIAANLPPALLNIDGSENLG
jgi:hypothetical protein